MNKLRCRTKFEYDSPSYPSCDYHVNLRKEVDRRVLVKGKDTVTPSSLEFHVKQNDTSERDLYTVDGVGNGKIT